MQAAKESIGRPAGATTSRPQQLQAFASHRAPSGYPEGFAQENLPRSGGERSHMGKIERGEQ